MLQESLAIITRRQMLFRHGLMHFPMVRSQTKSSKDGIDTSGNFRSLDNNENGQGNCCLNKTYGLLRDKKRTHWAAVFDCSETQVQQTTLSFARSLTPQSNENSMVHMFFTGRWRPWQEWLQLKSSRIDRHVSPSLIEECRCTCSTKKSFLCCH